jgi:hypothetical protein
MHEPMNSPAHPDTGPAEPPPRPSRSALFAAVTVVGALGLVLLAAELVTRVTRGELATTDNFIERQIRYDVHTTGIGQWDAALGWSTRPSAGADDGNASTDAFGFRHNARASERPVTATPLTLAVGDSYTWGFEVRNAESWPAALERLTGRRVINAGVPGYGVDQMVLRLEALLANPAVPRPQVVVLALIADDLARIRLQRRTGLWKPWFARDPAGPDRPLTLHGVPVPPLDPGLSSVTGLRGLFGYSLFIDTLARRVDETTWLHGVPLSEWDKPVPGPEETGVLLGCQLVRRARDRAHSAGAGFVAVTLPSWGEMGRSEWFVPFGQCVRDSGTALVAIDAVVYDDRERQRWFEQYGYAGTHLSAAANEWVAGQIRSTVDWAAAHPLEAPAQ